MTNKEKAQEVAKHRESEFGKIRDINGCCYMSALNMARWKDKEYKTAYVVTRSEEHCDYVEKSIL